MTSVNGKPARTRFGKYHIRSVSRVVSKDSQYNDRADSIYQTNSEREYSLIVTGPDTDSLYISVYQNLTEEELRRAEWVFGFDLNLPELLETEFSLDHEQYRELLSRSHFISAVFRIGHSENREWAFLMEDSWGGKTGFLNGAVLTSGPRTIRIYEAPPLEARASRGILRDFHSVARGYEFVENATSLAAVQISGNGIWGYSKKVVWLPGDLESELKLTLAGVILLLLQLNFAN